MNFVQRLIFENSKNSENLDAIKNLAEEVIEMLLTENDFVTGASIDQEGRLYFDFSQYALDLEDGHSLWTEASDYFHEHFNSRARQEFDFI